MSDTTSAPWSASAQSEADGRLFATTHWSMVMTAGKPESPQRQAALDRLCQIYRHPVYLFIRRRGHNAHEGEDLTQAFFARFLEKECVKSADRQKGRFRTFLLAAVSNFLANEWDKAQTLKRGGQRKVVSLEDSSIDEACLEDEHSSLSPEEQFDRRWAQTIMAQTLVRLKQEYHGAGKGHLLKVLEPGLTTTVPAATAAQWAAELGTSEGAIKVALHRIRRRFGQLLRSEVAQTVSRPEEIDEEIRHLCAALCQ